MSDKPKWALDEATRAALSLQDAFGGALEINVMDNYMDAYLIVKLELSTDNLKFNISKVLHDGLECLAFEGALRAALSEAKVNLPMPTGEAA